MVFNYALEQEQGAIELRVSGQTDAFVSLGIRALTK